MITEQKHGDSFIKKNTLPTIRIYCQKLKSFILIIQKIYQKEIFVIILLLSLIVIETIFYYKHILTFLLITTTATTTEKQTMFDGYNLKFVKIPCDLNTKARYVYCETDYFGNPLIFIYY